MKVEKTKGDALNIELTLTITSEDYAPIKKKKLSERRRNAEFKGFRKGNVPLPLIEKVYGEQCLVDAVNELISEQLDSYIKDNKLNIIGDPISSEDQPQLDWKDGNEFVFKFDLGLAPELKFELGKDDELPQYTIKSTTEAKEEFKKNLLMQYGELREVENPTDESYIYVDLANADKKVENAYISMRDVAEAVKPAIMGVKAGDKLNINVNELFDREGDRATLLKVKKEELAGINPEFEAVVVNIKNFMPAELTQETFDKIFGEGKVTDVEGFDKAVAERLAENYRQESDYRLNKDLKDYIIRKAALELPEDFLKRWLYTINKEKFTMEQIEKEFDAFLADYRWQMICDYLMKSYELKLSEEDLKEAAQGYLSYQYAMYGMANVPAEILNEQVSKMLQDSKQVQRLAESVAEQKVISAARERVTLTKKTISVEKFRELA